MTDKLRGWGAARGGNRVMAKGPNNYFSLGEWKFQCDQCARIFHSSAALKRWDNAMVCSSCIEIRNPQDFVQGVPDGQAPPWTRPRPPPTFVNGNGTQTSAEGADEAIDGQIVGGPMLG